METQSKPKENKDFNIHQRMINVMKNIGVIPKEGIHFQKYKYVKYDTIARILPQHLVENGINVVTNITKDEQIGNLSKIWMEISFINVENPTDRITVNFSGTGTDSQDKGTSKAITSAFKSCLLKTFILESGDEEDIEAHNIERTEYKKVNQEQMTSVMNLIDNNKARLPGLLNYLGAKNIEDINEDDYQKIIKMFKKNDSHKTKTDQIAERISPIN